MYKRKPIKITALLLTFCLLMTAFSGTAIQAQAEELGTSAQSQRASASPTFIYDHLYDSATFSSKRSLYSIAVIFVDTAYGDLFNVSFTSKSAPVLDTVTDLSSCAADESTPCSNAFNCGGQGLHHKDVGRIANLLYSAHIRNNGAISASNKYINSSLDRL